MANRGPNTAPRFTVTAQIGLVQVSTANTNLDGTGTIATVVTGASEGTRLDFLVIKATGTTTAGMIRLFLNDGTNTRLIREITVSAITPSGTTASFYQVVPLTVPDDEQLFILPNASWSLRASTHNAETFNLFAFGADF